MNLIKDLLESYSIRAVRAFVLGMSAGHARQVRKYATLRKANASVENVLRCRQMSDRPSTLLLFDQLDQPIR
jgi:hypothetical protein